MDQAVGSGFRRKTVLDMSSVWCLLTCHPGGHVKCGVIYLSLQVKGGIRVGVTSVGIFNISVLLNPGARTEARGGACKEGRRLKTESTSGG